MPVIDGKDKAYAAGGASDLEVSNQRIGCINLWSRKQNYGGEWFTAEQNNEIPSHNGSKIERVLK